MYLILIYFGVSDLCCLTPDNSNINQSSESEVPDVPFHQNSFWKRRTDEYHITFTIWYLQSNTSESCISKKKTDHSKIYFILFIPDINIVLPAWGRATIALEVEAPTLTSSASFISLCLGLDNKSLVEELCGNLGLHLWPWSTKIYSPNKLQYKTNCKSCNLS